jgi:hypothetical protein
MRREHRCSCKKLVEHSSFKAMECEAGMDIQTCALRESGRASETS